jgi:putative hydrolase of the HAD superfamily
VNPNIQGRDQWVFDLDNTLYPAHFSVYEAVGERMTACIARLTGLPHAEAEQLRETYFERHGASVVGLMRHHGCDPFDFMAYVHEVPLDEVQPDPVLCDALARLPGRKLVFTNGSHGYAWRIVTRLGAADLFERVFALEDSDFVPKPERAAFERLIRDCNVDPHRAVFLDDHPRNIETARALGFVGVQIGASDGLAHGLGPIGLHEFLAAVLNDAIDLTPSPA